MATAERGATRDATGPADLRAVGDRIDALLDATSSHGVAARERAEELVRLVADLYGAGLERILELLHDAGRLDDQALAALAEDDLVASLLIVHGLHPYGVEQRVEQALDRVRPYLGSHGGDVELLEVTADGTVRLRLLGSCDGCPSSAVTLKLAVEGAIEAAAPEITALEVELRDDGPVAPVIPVDSLMSRVHDPEVVGAWQAVPELALLAPGAVIEVAVRETPTVGCRAGEDLYAFRSACPRCGSGLAGAALAEPARSGRCLLVCPGCRARYDVRRAGACLDEPALHLEPLPLLRDGGVVSVAIPAPLPS